jgi:hypothetical protein
MSALAIEIRRQEIVTEEEQEPSVSISTIVEHRYLW